MIAQVLNVVPVLDEFPASQLLRLADSSAERPSGRLRAPPFLSSLGARSSLRFRIDGLSQKQLVERAVIEQPAMIATQKRMEAAGLLIRDTDGRSRTFHLTRAGRAAIPRLTKILVDGNTRALAGFLDEDRRLLVTLLRRVIDRAKGPP